MDRIGGPTVPVPVAVALGSNLGDRRGHLEWAALQLGHILPDLRLSPIVESEPFDVPDIQPPYLNAVAIGLTTAGPRELLEELQNLERRRGRLRTGVRSARTLDLDLILYDDRILSGEGLEIPHPRFRERLFVLEPLAVLAPEMRDPVTGLTIAELVTRARR